MAADSIPPPGESTRPRRTSRGFTLVELMVTLAGGLFLSIAVFLISKHTTALYQRETRAAGANLASVVGFDRLRSDIARAGYMSSPHVRRDPFVCGNPTGDGSWPALLRSMSSIQITNQAPVPAVLADNGIAPHRLLLSGNYASTEAFPIRTVFPSASGFTVNLQVNSGAMARIGYHAAPVAQRQAILQAVFPPGRAIRIVDKSGRHHFGTLAAVNVNPLPTLTVAASAPALVFRAGTGLGCGLRGEETGAMINTVNFIRYELRSLSGNAGYAPLFPADPANPSFGPAYDASRLELVREELDPTGAVVANTTELVAEYAVDLRFRLTVAPSQAVPLQYVGDAALAAYAGDPTAMVNTAAGPQMIRTVHTWLSVRSREADRSANIPVAAAPLYRIGLGAGGTAPFARLRTIQARIALHNQLGITWQ